MLVWSAYRALSGREGIVPPEADEELVPMVFPPSPFNAKWSHSICMSGDSSAKSLSHSQHLSSCLGGEGGRAGGREGGRERGREGGREKG